MNDRVEELIRRVTETEQDQHFAYQRPKDAATLILVDRTGKTPKVLLGRRHHRHEFVPDKFVFPGGRVEAHDRRMASAAHLDPRVEARLMLQVGRPSREQARALVLAAIRETFEETGLLLGLRMAGAPALPHAAWAAFAEAGVHPDLGGIHFIARAITPPRRPRRFDARFFTADASAVTHRVEGVVGPDTELVELVWLPIAEAKRLDLPAITTTVLNELEARIAAGLSHDLPVPFYRTLHKRITRQLL